MTGPRKVELADMPLRLDFGAAVDRAGATPPCSNTEDDESSDYVALVVIFSHSNHPKLMCSRFFLALRRLKLNNQTSALFDGAAEAEGGRNSDKTGGMLLRRVPPERCVRI